MAIRAHGGERRAGALSKGRIVEAAIGILDAEGEKALTFRALSARLATGAGAIYWHVANKDELLAAATEDVVSGVLAGVARGADPCDGVRALALGVFDAIDAHPWVGAQLTRDPWGPAPLRIFDRFGGRVRELGVDRDGQVDVASALLNHVLGAAARNAAQDRPDLSARTASRWAELDAARYPFLRQAAAELARQDDRARFLAGVDLILAGIDTARRAHG